MCQVNCNGETDNAGKLSRLKVMTSIKSVSQVEIIFSVAGSLLWLSITNI